MYATSNITNYFNTVKMVMKIMVTLMLFFCGAAVSETLDN